MSTATTKITATDECSAHGCIRDRQRAREAGQKWITVHGKTTTLSGRYVEVEHAETCPQHAPEVTQAVAEAMSRHGGTWEVETVTYNHALEISVGITHTPARKDA